jgi:hypothetical protein
MKAQSFKNSLQIAPIHPVICFGEIKLICSKLFADIVSAFNGMEALKSYQCIIRNHPSRNERTLGWGYHVL